jgi:hypothetical protein
MTSKISNLPLIRRKMYIQTLLEKRSNKTHSPRVSRVSHSHKTRDNGSDGPLSSYTPNDKQCIHCLRTNELQNPRSHQEKEEEKAQLLFEVDINQ